MRHGRAKATRKTLQFFARTHGYAPPYHVLLDGTFVVSTLQFKVPVLDRLRSVLQGESFHLYVTRSTLTELHQLHKAQQLSNKEKGALLEEAYLWAATNATVLENEEGPAEGSAQSSVNKSKGTKRGTTAATHNSGTKEAVDVPADAVAESSDDDSVNDDVAARGGAHSGMSAAGREMYRIVTASAAANLTRHRHVRSEAGGANESRSKGQAHDASQSASRRYFFASQDEALLDAVRAAGCVPIVRLAHHSVLLLEPPSREARGLATKSERHKWSAQSAVSDPERELVRLVREATKRPSSSQQHGSHVNPATTLTRKPDSFRQRKVKKAKGPNPLSCRKRETATTATHDGATSSKVGGDTRRQRQDPKDDVERPTKRRRRRK